MFDFDALDQLDAKFSSCMQPGRESGLGTFQVDSFRHVALAKPRVGVPTR